MKSNEHNPTEDSSLGHLFKPFREKYSHHDIGQGKGVYISTYGCQMNVNDTDRMYALLEMANFSPVPTPEQASLIIINACSVREKPVHKVFSEVGTYRQLKNKNPHLKIGVGGCVGSQEKGNLIDNQPLIDFVFGTDNIDSLPEIVARAFGEPESSIIETQFRHREPYMVETLVRNPGVSTFVNITKGCDNFCTFCVVPYTRGREKSRPYSHVIEDVNTLLSRGVKEVTLLGQNVNSYRSECGKDFADLLEGLVLETTAERIRYTTSHPKDFDEKLMHTMARYNPRICEYIHLPVQSGSSQVLERMNRGYTREEYLNKVAQIQKILPQAVLSTDIIVGFPGETEAQFQETVSLVLEVGYETIYAFKYSPRPYTKAARFEDQVSEDIKSQRLDILLKAHDEMARKKVKKYEGQVLPVLIDRYDEQRGSLSGRTTQNKNVFMSGDPSWVGQTLPVRITQAFPATMRGEVIQK